MENEEETPKGTHTVSVNQQELFGPPPSLSARRGKHLHILSQPVFAHLHKLDPTEKARRVDQIVNAADEAKWQGFGPIDL